MTITVYYRCADGRGTIVWKHCVSRAEAEAQKKWCARSLQLRPTMVWALGPGKEMVGEILFPDDPTPSPSPPDRS